MSDLMTLAEYIRSVAEKFRANDTCADDLIADAIDDLARSVEFTQAETPGEYVRRQEVIEAVACGVAA